MFTGLDRTSSASGSLFGRERGIWVCLTTPSPLGNRGVWVCLTMPSPSGNMMSRRTPFSILCVYLDLIRRTADGGSRKSCELGCQHAQSPTASSDLQTLNFPSLLPVTPCFAHRKGHRQTPTCASSTRRHERSSSSTTAISPCTLFCRIDGAMTR